jgi:hypothetical protein
LEGPFKGRVVAHAEKLQMEGVKFRVSEAGRRRVIRTGRKNVHAGAEGEITMAWGLVPASNDVALTSLGINGVWEKLHGRRVRYNPYECPLFTSGDSVYVTSASRLQIDRCSMRAVGLK